MAGTFKIRKNVAITIAIMGAHGFNFKTDAPSINNKAAYKNCIIIKSMKILKKIFWVFSISLYTQQPIIANIKLKIEYKIKSHPNIFIPNFTLVIYPPCQIL